MGFENSRELRGPRWRTLVSAISFKSIGYKYVIAGKLVVVVLLKNLTANKIPRGGIVHKSAISSWFPFMLEIKPVL